MARIDRNTVRILLWRGRRRDNHRSRSVCTARSSNTAHAHHLGIIYRINEMEDLLDATSNAVGIAMSSGIYGGRGRFRRHWLYIMFAHPQQTLDLRMRI